MALCNDLPELIQQKVITPETAEQIRLYYQRKQTAPSHRLFTIFGILGALLVGMGLILILAHNWDELSRGIKTTLAFLPLLVGQALAGYTLLRKKAHPSWRESTAVGLFLSVGASIALVAQIYHIPGGSGTFVRSWMLLVLPLVYVLSSSAASLLYLAGITYYATLTNQWDFPPGQGWHFWLLLLAILPYYYRLCRQQPGSNFFYAHNWLLPAAVGIGLSTLQVTYGSLLFLAYFNLAGFFYLVGYLPLFRLQPQRNNGFKLMGHAGLLILLLTASFTWFWKDLRQETFFAQKLLVAPEFWVTVLIFVLSTGLLLYHYRQTRLKDMLPLAPVFLLFTGIFIIGRYTPAAVVLANLLVLALGVLIIRQGTQQDHLGRLNLGLALLTVLLICRFFDTQLTFVLRGVLFVVVGAGFFLLNFWMLKKRKAHGPA